MLNINVSVIIPVYNSEEYLRKCLDSVVNQTLDSKEIIIINDGSKDRSLDIIREYEKKYEFIKVIDKENEGVSIARNKGIEIARGEYISFVDSDDIIEKNMLAVMFNEARANELDIIECNFQRFEQEDKLVFIGKREIEREILKNNDIIKSFLNFKIKGYLWNKIYRKDLLIKNNILFENIICFEDMMFNLKVATYAKRYMKVENNFYKYRITRGSASYHIDKNKVKIYSTEIEKWMNFIELNRKKDIVTEIEVFRIKVFLNLLVWFKSEFTKKNKEYKKLYKEIVGKHEKCFLTPSVLFNNNFSRGEKLLFVLYKMKCIDIYIFFINLKNKL